ncbi:MAG: hypothetical protein V7637_5737, partial [Mycobacteriales bacterium]
MDGDAAVIVVGAGPTGLLVAGDLAAAGVRTLLLERRAGQSNLTRAFAVHARTLESLDARGLADELIGTGQPLRALRLLGRFDLDLSRLPTRYPFVLVTPQYETERLLSRRARAAGAEIADGAEAVAVRQAGDGVEVDVRDASGDVRTRRAAYLVGADGVHSSVRRALGVPFPGRSLAQSVMLADVRLAEPPADVLLANSTGEGFAFVAPFGDGWYRVIAFRHGERLPDTAPVELDEIREITRAALGTDLGIHDARWMSRFHNDERQTPRYRIGRVFLAGDAAHVHSPAGGQGMNTGLQDAANLSWKLAAAIQGWAPDGLLDTYEGERHPVGKLVLRSSGAIIRLAMVKSRLGRMARNFIGGNALRLPPIAHKAAGVISGIGIDYPGAPRAADVPLKDSGRLYEALRDGKFVLLTPDPSVVPP